MLTFKKFALSTLSFFFFASSSFSLSAVAGTVYPSVNDLPFPWDNPRMAINLDHLSESLPKEEILLKSRVTNSQGNQEYRDGCSINIAEDTAGQSLEIEMSGKGNSVVDGNFVEIDVQTSFNLPLSHYVEPMRQRPFTRFGFPETFVTVGELENVKDGLRLRISVYRGFSLSKLANTPYVVAPAGVPESISMIFDSDGDSLVGFSIFAMGDDRQIKILSCKSSEEIELLSKIKPNRLFIKDLP